MRVDVAIVGGTGVGNRLADLGGRAMLVPTPFGPLRGRLLEEARARVLLVQRHAARHTTPPHRVNYRALAAGLRAMGARACLATAAVGCLRPEWPLGTALVCTDFMDLTARRLTMWDQAVRHVDFTAPFDLDARCALLEAAREHGLTAHGAGIYLGLDGPRYETPAEIAMMRGLGADLVGMTASSEAICCREAGVPYACLAIVTNMAAGMGAATLDHSEVLDAMQAHGPAITATVIRAARVLSERPSAGI